MHNLYITFRDGSIHFYAYKYDEKLEKVTYEELTDKEISAETYGMNHLPIKKVSETEKSLTVTLSNNQNIEIDTLEVFKQKDSQYFEELKKFMIAIDKFISNKNLEEFKNKLPEGHIPRTNRHKSKNFGRRILAGGLAAGCILGVASIAYANNKNDKKDKMEFSPLPEKTLEMIADEVSPKVTPLNFEIAEVNELLEKEIEKERIDLEFEYLEDGKLQSTIDYCGDLISYDTVCSQITQERPNITADGSLRNPCQLTNFVGNKLTVPVYNELGPTGEYDTYTVTEDMVNSLDWNIKIGVGYLRCCTNKYDSLISGIFAYNQGINALSNACKYYDLDLEEYKGDENAIKARDLVVQYYKELKEKGITKGTHGDPLYLEHVFRYANLEDRGKKQIEYILGSELKTVEIHNTLEYNSDLGTR